jgi:hypothetical protein
VLSNGDVLVREEYARDSDPDDERYARLAVPPLNDEATYMLSLRDCQALHGWLGLILAHKVTI